MAYSNFVGERSLLRGGTASKRERSALIGTHFASYCHSDLYHKICKGVILSMKALQIAQAGVCRFLDLPMPELVNDDSVIVEVKCVGICGSDVHSYVDGNNCPVIPGHEVVGIVHSKGKNVAKLELGDHVVLEPLVSCGECYACKKGIPNVCEKAMCIGCQTDGGMREFFQYDQHHWHRIPKELPFDTASLIEPYTVGLEVVSRGEVMRGDTVLIHGAGPAGLIAMDLAKRRGATCIVSEAVDGLSLIHI